MQQEYDDGGRRASGTPYTSRDCVARSIAIATSLPYRTVCDGLNEIAKSERRGKRKRGISSDENGVYKYTTRRYLKSLGWVWTPTMHFGSGCKVHLRSRELPKGRLVVSLSKHVTAVIDGVIHDTHDPSRDGNRCVYGYWTVAPLD